MESTCTTGSVLDGCIPELASAWVEPTVCTFGTVVWDEGGGDNRGVFRRAGCTDLSVQRRPYSPKSFNIRR